MIKKLTMDITGTTPMLMHSARLADPLDEIARAMKKVSAKRAKSEEDYAELARLEFMGGLYFDEQYGPFVPGDNVFRSLVDAGRKRKLGQKVTTGLFVATDVNPLVYVGPRTVEELWADGRFRHSASVKVGTSRVVRTRPVFQEWSTSVELVLDTELLDLDDLRQLVDISGAIIGLGDWRPRFGRFEATLIESE